MSNTILVLDDEANFAEMIQGLLIAEGYDAEVSTNPHQALEQIRSKHYALVIADFKMPEMDGDIFLQKVREINVVLPVIIVSGLMNTPDLMRVANIGVTLALEKPFQREQLLKHVAHFIAPKQPEAPVSPKKSKLVSLPGEIDLFLGKSPAMVRFLQALWGQLDTSGIGLVFAEDGHEMDLVCKQVSKWASFEAPCMRLGFFSWLKNIRSIIDRTKDRLILIEMLDASIGALPALLTEEFVSKWQARNVKLIFRFQKKAQIDDASISILQFPLLRSRAGDIAALIDSELLRGEVHINDPELLQQLLAYPWKDNFRELKLVLMRLSRRDAAQRINGLKRFLTDRMESGHGSVSMTSLLHSEQKNILQRVGTTELDDVLERLDIDRNVLSPDTPLQQQDFLYPELLTTE